MQRILSDHDVQGQVSRLMDLCQRPPWVGLWRELECVLCTFEDFDLSEDATDATIWQTCQLPIRPINFPFPEFPAACRAKHLTPAVAGCLPVTLTGVSAAAGCPLRQHS